MKKVTQLLLFLLITTMNVNSQENQKYIDIDLWTNGKPNSNEIDKQPYDDKTQNFKPTIRVFLPAKEKSTKQMILMCPGGGYGHLAMNHEGYDWAPYLNEKGIALAVLKYRMPNGGYFEVPGSDAIEAMRIIREKADEWNIDKDKVGIAGFSAGGHLASTIATQAPEAERPSFQILFYPVITMDEQYTHKGSRQNLIGENASIEMVNRFSGEQQVDSLTPPAFIAFSSDDKTVSPVNGLRYYQALLENNIPASLHIWPTGRHGWGYRESFEYHEQMINELSKWLDNLK